MRHDQRLVLPTTAYRDGRLRGLRRSPRQQPDRRTETATPGRSDRGHRRRRDARRRHDAVARLFRAVGDGPRRGPAPLAQAAQASQGGARACGGSQAERLHRHRWTRLQPRHRAQAQGAGHSDRALREPVHLGLARGPCEEDPAQRRPGALPLPHGASDLRSVLGRRAVRGPPAGRPVRHRSGPPSRPHGLGHSQRRARAGRVAGQPTRRDLPPRHGVPAGSGSPAAQVSGPAARLADGERQVPGSVHEPAVRRAPRVSKGTTRPRRKPNGPRCATR